MHNLAYLQLAQLADSALPIGSTAHSFGLETLIAENGLRVEQLETFFREYIHEVGGLEGAFCRLAHRLVSESDEDRFAERWLEINAYQSALKMARESRTASA